MLSTTALSRRIHSARNGRALLNLAVVPVLGLVLAFSACGSSSSNSSDTPGSSPTTSSQASRTKAECSSKAILSALPGGATMQEFTCAKVGDTEWAAARVSPGDTVFFLRWNGTKWNAEDSQSICGTASAGLPQSLLSYCKAAPSSSPTTPATAACTSEAILAALPASATMEKFTCADVGGKLWAAARVSPGDTVFFLQMERHQMERRGLRQRLRHRIGGPAPVATVLLQGGPVLVADDAGHRGLHVRGDSCRAPGRRHDAGVHLRRRRWQVVGRCAC